MTDTAAPLVRQRNLARLAGRAPVQQIYEDLHGRIVNGTLRPGEALTEAGLAESYGLSRTPIREVFWRLNEEGLLRVVPQVGTFVAPISIAAVNDSQFVRETLECGAIVDAARAATPCDVAVLREFVATQAEAIRGGDFVRFFALDEALHRRLMEMAGHPSVWQIIAGAKAQLDRVRFLALEEPGWEDMVLAQHTAVIDRVAARDPEGARAAMREHLDSSLVAIEHIAAKNADFFDGRGAGS